MNSIYYNTPAAMLRENIEASRNTYSQELNRLSRLVTAKDADAARASAFRLKIYNKIIKTLEEELDRRGLALQINKKQDNSPVYNTVHRSINEQGDIAMIMPFYRKAREAAQRAFGLERDVWDVEPLEDGVMVIICDTGKRTGTGDGCRAFSVHTYYPETGKLYAGAYDLTMQEAWRERDERVSMLRGRASRLAAF